MSRRPPNTQHLNRRSLSIGRNQSITGNLNRTDKLIDAQYYFDSYYLETVSVEQQVHITLDSSHFDTYLQLVDTRTEEVFHWSNDGPDNTNAALTFVAKPGVTYELQVTSNLEKETGSYTLTTRSISTKAPDGFNFFWGSGLVNAAAAVARSMKLDRSLTAPLRAADKVRWGLRQINASEVWANGVTGKDMVVAVMDSGIDFQHPALKHAIWKNPGEIADNGVDDDQNGFVDDVRGWDFVGYERNEDSTRDLGEDSNPFDHYGHGTHVSGIVAAKQGRTKGVAYDAKIMPIRVLDSQNSYYSDRILARGIRYAVNNGAQIINLSLGTSYPGLGNGAQLEAAVRLAYNRGVTVIFSAGNDRQNYLTERPNQPAYFTALERLGFAVGSTNRQREFSSFGNPAGPKFLNYVVAPGEDVLSTVPRFLKTYDTYSGTSMAAPHVAGVVALMRQANPLLTVDEIAQILRKTSTTAGLSLFV